MTIGGTAFSFYLEARRCSDCLIGTSFSLFVVQSAEYTAEWAQIPLHVFVSSCVACEFLVTAGAAENVNKIATPQNTEGEQRRPRGSVAGLFKGHGQSEIFDPGFVSLHIFSAASVHSVCMHISVCVYILSFW